MSIYDREWFKDVRAILDNANGLKQTPPQNDVKAVHKAPESSEPDWYSHMVGFQEAVEQAVADMNAVVAVTGIPTDKQTKYWQENLHGKPVQTPLEWAQEYAGDEFDVFPVGA